MQPFVARCSVSWSQLRGHDGLVGSFQRILRDGRLAHAYLFVGPEGIGKRTFAIELAKTLLCEATAATPFDACDRCPACLQVMAGTHPDYHYVGLPEDKLEFPIDAVQTLIQQLALRPARGRWRVTVLDDADTFSDAAANCLLKTLEEPPSRSVLCLLGTAPERQLPTILSRCQVVPFAPLPLNVVDALLEQEGVTDAAARRFAADHSQGSLARARRWLDAEVREFVQSLDRFLAAPRGKRQELVDLVGKFVDEAGKESAAKRGRAQLVLEFLLESFERELRSSVAASGHTGDTLNRLETCLRAESQVDRKLQLALVMEAACDALGVSLSRA